MIEDVNLIMALFVLFFIVCDFVTGIAKAVMNKNLDSTKMREGLFHKLAFVLALIVGYACQFATVAFELPAAFDAVYPGVALWIVLTEIASIFENLIEINPELADSPLAGIISGNKD